MDVQNWISNPQPKLPYHDCVNNVILSQQSLIPDIMPNFRQAERLYVTSDYGGEIRHSQTESYSFLIFDAECFQLWNALRLKLREFYNVSSKLLKYSSIDNWMDCLVPLLCIAGCLRGLLISFVVEKQIPSLFTETGLDSIAQLQTEPIVNYPPDQKEKIFRIGSFIGFVLGALTRENQSILWVPDKDNTTNNPIRLKAAREKIKDISSNFLPHRLTWTEPESLVSDQSLLHIEDLNAIADFAASASARYFSARIEQNLNTEIFGTPAIPSELPRKTEIIIDWLRHSTIHLKRKVFYLYKGEPPIDKQVKDLEFYFINSIT